MQGFSRLLKKGGTGCLMFLVLILSTFSQTLDAAKIDGAEAFVGISARLEQIVLPGSELKTRPLSDRQRPVVLRIEQTYPHGSDFRYDMVYYGLEPGEYDLRDYLLRVDGSPVNDLPPLIKPLEKMLRQAE